MLIGGIVRRMGVDFGTGKTRAQFHEDTKKGATLCQEVDGLDVYEDDTMFLVAENPFVVSGTPKT
jgi:hypothetical protein